MISSLPVVGKVFLCQPPSMLPAFFHSPVVPYGLSWEMLKDTALPIFRDALVSCVLNMLAFLAVIWLLYECMRLGGFSCGPDADFITTALTTEVPSILLPNLPANPCFLPLLPGIADGGKRDSYQILTFCSYGGKEAKRPPHVKKTHFSGFVP